MFTKVKARAVAAKIKPLVPDNPDARLMFAVFVGALQDLFLKDERDAAIRYLSGDMVHLTVIGIDVEWVKELLVKMNAFKGK